MEAPLKAKQILGSLNVTFSSATFSSATTLASLWRPVLLIDSVFELDETGALDGAGTGAKRRDRSKRHWLRWLAD